MPRRVITSREAKANFEAARSWLLQPGSGARGRAKWEQLKQSRRDLRDFPCLGDTKDPDHRGRRRRIVAGYRLIYLVEPDTNDNATAGNVQILALFGPGQL